MIVLHAMWIVQLIEQLPRTHLTVGLRRLPPFRTLGLLGFDISLAVVLLVGLVVGLPAILVAGMAATASIAFLGWLSVRKVITGSERMVQLEDIWIVVGSVVAFGWVAGGPILRLLDILSIGISTFLVFGRIGCAMVGCCYGHPSPTGFRYTAEHGLHPRLTDRPLFPVQLIEAAGLLGIAFGGLLLAGQDAGFAFAWFLLAGAILRFGTDALRGDKRVHFAGVSSVRFMSLVQFGAGLALCEYLRTGLEPDEMMLVSALVLSIALLVGTVVVVRRKPNPLITAHHLEELWDTVGRLKREAGSDEPVTDETSQGMRIGVTTANGGCHVSVSHPRHDVGAAVRDLGGVEIASANGVTHVWLDGGPLVGQDSLLRHVETPAAPVAPPVSLAFGAERSVYFGLRDS